jgi:pimeloyl-ACP methyl ester carboxylesterase
MNPRTLLQAAVGLFLCALGYYLAHRESNDVHTVLATAGGCQMATDIYEPRSGSPLGSVVLFHGLAANKKVMAFNAQEFANQELRVFVPDLPGHGRTPGPYSAERDDSCALALVQELAERKAIVPERTILAGHSLGGAIAIRAASKFPVAGVIALSPAPMRAVRGFSAEMIPFHNVPVLPPHSLILTGQWEPGPLRSLARELVASPSSSSTAVPTREPSSKYQMIPHTTHVSILFSKKTFAELRAWTFQLLGTNPDAPSPKSMPALGCVLGIAGLSILVPSFLREMNTVPKSSPTVSAPTPSFIKAFAVVTAVALGAALLLASHLVPIHFVRVFQGDYLGVFLFLTGLAVLAIFRKSWFVPKSLSFSSLVSTAASALVLVLLFGGWFELTFYEAWLTPARWLRFPLLFLLLLPWHFAEEILLGPPAASFDSRRLFKALAIRSAVSVVLYVGIVYLHSGAILFFLLLAYLMVFSVLQRLACDLVRFRTQSSAAAAIFGAILLAAFALAIFPVA